MLVVPGYLLAELDARSWIYPVSPIAPTCPFFGSIAASSKEIVHMSIDVTTK